MSDIDELARVRREKAKLERLDNILTEKVSRLGFGAHEGERYIAVVALRERTAVDLFELQVVLPTDVWSPFVKTTTHTEIILSLVARRTT